MNLSKKKLLNLALAANLLVAPLWAHAQAGDRGGNGGDGMIAEFEYNVEQIGKWVSRGNLKKIKLENVDAATLEQAMIVQAKRIINHEVKISFVSESLTIPNSAGPSDARTCKNYPLQMKVECNVGKWSAETPQSRYTLVMHELLGLAGFEANDGIFSEYRISRQLMPYVMPQTNYILSDSVNEEIDRVPFVHCEGSFKRVNDWSLRHYKRIIVNMFPNHQIYTSEFVYPLGATNMRQITGGTRGHWKYKSSGIDKIARYFNSESPTVTVIKQETARGGSYNGLTFYGVDAFSEHMAFTPPTSSSGVGVLGGLAGEGNGISMRCEFYKHDKKVIEDLMQYTDKLSQRGPVSYTIKEKRADFHFVSTHCESDCPSIPRGY